MLRFLVLASALLAVACPSKQTPCRLHSDCPEAERCVGGACTLICRTDRDCEGLGSCIQGQCVLVVNGGGSGGSSGGVAGGSTAGGSTAGGSSAGGSTAGGRAGGAGTAGGATAGGATAGGATAGGATAGGATAGGATAGGATAGGATAGGMGNLMFGETCTGGSQCMSMLCVGVGTAGQGICTIACADESVCPAGWGCLMVGVQKVCMLSDSGRPCSQGCFSGTCLGGSSGVCSTPCESTRACPQSADFSCSPVSGIGGRWCVPAGATCSAPATCVSSNCATPAVGPNNGVCTSVCRDARDCPDGWMCDGLDGRCLPIGEVCTVNMQAMNDCVSQTCAEPDDGGASFCTGFCMNAQLQQQPLRCPSGWTCTGVPAGMETWYVCERP